MLTMGFSAKGYRMFLELDVLLSISQNISIYFYKNIVTNQFSKKYVYVLFPYAYIVSLYDTVWIFLLSQCFST